MAGAATPASRPIAIAASAFCTLCTPGRLSSTARSGTPSARATNRMRPPSFAMSVARRRASGGHSVGHDRLGDGGQDFAHVRIVDAEHRDAVERQALGEIDERALQPLEVVAVGLHVIGVDVGDHRHRRRQVEERRVGFVRLGDEKIAGAEPRVRIRRQEAPADDERRVEAALGQHRRDETRGRRLAVRAGDRDALLQAHQLGQHQRTRHDGNSALARRDDFRIVRRHRRRHDDRIGAGDIRRGMTDRDADAEPRKARGHRARGEIGARDLVALRGQHLRDAAHPGAADADEMDALDLVLHRPDP